MGELTIFVNQKLPENFIFFFNKCVNILISFSMADVHSKQTRSYNMSMIKGKNTKPEIIVRKYLHKNGFRFRLHVKKLPGKPDIVLSKYKTVIFVNGCFWHGHENCKYFVVPKTRTDWWLNKIERNIMLDKEYITKLNSEGWKVINIFECGLKKGLENATLLITQLNETHNGNSR